MTWTVAELRAVLALPLDDDRLRVMVVHLVGPPEAPPAPVATNPRRAAAGRKGGQARVRNAQASPQASEASQPSQDPSQPPSQPSQRQASPLAVSSGDLSSLAGSEGDQSSEGEGECERENPTAASLQASQPSQASQAKPGKPAKPGPKPEDPWGLVPTGQDPDAPKAVAKAPKSAKPDLALACLEEPERIAYEVIISDESLAPIVPRPAACARDLCAIGPGVDVAMEIRKAGAWLRSHPEQRKSLGAAYLGRWITRAQESARHRPTLAAQAQRLRAVPPPRDDGAPPATPAEQRAVDELRSKGRPTDEELMAPMVIPEHLRGAAS